MFDIGFSEIVLIGVVALVVIGPERLPKTARTLGLLFGRLQRYVNDVKADISREMELDELRRLQQEVRGAARDLEQSVRTAANDMTTSVRGIERDLNAAAAADAPSENTSAAAAPLAPSPAPADDGAPAPRQAALPGFDKI